MNPISLCAVIGASGLALVAAAPASPQAPAASPRLTVARRAAPAEEAWHPRTPLVFEVVLEHPCMTGAEADDEFVLDPAGGWAQAIELVVTDRTGAPVSLPFTRNGGNENGPLRLQRLERRSLWFDLQPSRQVVALGAGPLQVAARLRSTSGTWVGTVTSRPIALEVGGATAPTLSLGGPVQDEDATGGNATPTQATLFRGWPAVVSVTIRVTDARARVVLARPEDWAAAVSLVLYGPDGAAVADTIQGQVQQLPIVIPERRRLDSGDACIVQFRIPAAASQALAEGAHRWVAALQVAARPNGDRSAWAGSVSAAARSLCVAPPSHLPDDLVVRHARALVHDDLARGAVLRGIANDRSAELAPRQRSAEELAHSLRSAERRARALLAERQNDESAWLLLAEVLAAAGDPLAAGHCARRAVAVEFARRHAAAGNGAEADQPDLLLAAYADGIAGGGRPLDSDVEAAFQAAWTNPSGAATPSTESPRDGLRDPGPQRRTPRNPSHRMPQPRRLRPPSR